MPHPSAICGLCLAQAQCHNRETVVAFGATFLAGCGNQHRCATNTSAYRSCRAIERMSANERATHIAPRLDGYGDALKKLLRVYLKRSDLDAPANLHELVAMEVARVRRVVGARELPETSADSAGAERQLSA